MKTFIIQHKIIIALILLTAIFITAFTLKYSRKSNIITSGDSTRTPYSDTLKEAKIQPGVNSVTMYETFNSSPSMSLSVGGAKDIDNFRQNIKNGFMPVPTDVTYEGLFYDYYFDPGKTGESRGLFSPSYSFAVSINPITEKKEYFLAVGLNSNLKKSDFRRKKLNLMVVLDRSGSMSSPLDNYYYDRFRENSKKKKHDHDENSTLSKMELANETIANILNHMNYNDRFGFATFDDRAELVIPMRSVSKLDITDVKKKILETNPGGGTNMEAGFKTGLAEYDETGTDPDEYENRIIFLTDAMPNTGRFSGEDVFGMMKSASDKKIYTSFIGIGVDFNTELTETITKIRGANYYSAHSNEDFKKRLDDEFEYMVTPVVFGLDMNFLSKGFEIEKVYGSPESELATNEIMKVNTLFPSDSKDGEGRGGIIILKLNKISSESPEITINVSYENRKGKKISDNTKIRFPLNYTEHFDNNGIRKAVLLLRYAGLLKEWMENGSEAAASNNKTPGLNQWERQSNNILITEKYMHKFKEFKKYFKQEMGSIGDKRLRREIEVLNMLTEKENVIEEEKIEK